MAEFLGQRWHHNEHQRPSAGGFVAARMSKKWAVNTAQPVKRRAREICPYREWKAKFRTDRSSSHCGTAFCGLNERTIAWDEPML